MSYVCMFHNWWQVYSNIMFCKLHIIKDNELRNDLLLIFFLFSKNATKYLVNIFITENLRLI